MKQNKIIHNLKYLFLFIVLIGFSCDSSGGIDDGRGGINPIVAALEQNIITIPAGTFEMGCKTGRDEDCDEYNDDEKPVHTVSISSFKLNKYEVTQKEWKTIM